MKKAVIGTVETHAQADSVIAQLQAAGFPNRDISVIFPDPKGFDQTVTRKVEVGDKSSDGAITGIGAGGIFGASIGLLAGIGLLAIPGLGPFIAAGPIVATLTGLAAGATAGGFVGALIGLGIPEEQARRFAQHVRGGGALIAVHVESQDEQRRAQDLLSSIGASHVAATPESSRTAARGL